MKDCSGCTVQSDATAYKALAALMSMDAGVKVELCDGRPAWQQLRSEAKSGKSVFICHEWLTARI